MICAEGIATASYKENDVCHIPPVLGLWKHFLFSVKYIIMMIFLPYH